MTKTLALAAVALALPVSGAFAGGFSAPVVEAPVVAEVVQVTMPSFAGGYIGGALGYACCGDDEVGLNPAGSGNMKANRGNLKLSGANFGIQGGYRWQGGNSVYGAELGLMGGNVKADASDRGVESSTKLKHALTAKLSAGMLMNENTLAYVSGGLAHGSFDYAVKDSTSSIDASFSRVGYVIGLGVERSINENTSIKGEWEYMNFGKEELGSASTVVTKATPKFHNFKVGVNFRF